MLNVLLCASLVSWIAFQLPAQDWNQWRGPKRDGTVQGFTTPATWPERPKQVWKVAAGFGHSSPVVSGNRVFVLSRIGEQEAMTAYDVASGKQLWRQAYDAPYTVNPAAMSHGKGPKATPVVDASRVYALGISGVLSAFDAASGKVLWRHDFRREFPGGPPEYGAAMSPLIDGGQLIAHVGGAGAGALIAVDAKSGTRTWTWKGDGPAYASPVIGTLGGTRHLVTQTQSHLIGLSPADGRELWRIPFITDYNQNIVTPVIADGLLIYAGLSKPTVAVRVVREGAAWKLQEVWRNDSIPMYMSSPVAAGGVLYGLTHRNRGQFIGVDIATGKTLWTSSPRQAENAALTAVGDLLVATTTEGELIVVRQGRDAFQLIRKYTVADSPIWAHPAFTTRGILVKDAETLSYWTF